MTGPDFPGDMGLGRFFETSFFGLFWVFFILIAGVILFAVIRGILQWNKNNHSPRLTVDARIVSKRTDFRHHHTPVAGDASGAHGFTSTGYTDYYITFQVESGDRVEFSVDGREFGLLAEGDSGRLSFQGTRYLGFDRI